MNLNDAFATLDGNEWDAESLADSAAAFLNAGLKPSTGTQSRNIRMAIQSGVIQRNGSGWVTVQENILELDELMELDWLGIGDAFPFG